MCSASSNTLCFCHDSRSMCRLKESTEMFQKWIHQRKNPRCRRWTASPTKLDDAHSL
jgi:ribosomal protein L24E